MSVRDCVQLIAIYVTLGPEALELGAAQCGSTAE